MTDVPTDGIGASVLVFGGYEMPSLEKIPQSFRVRFGCRSLRLQ